MNLARRSSLRRLVLSCLAALTLASACSSGTQAPCNYHDDCATPREYCSAQTNLCTLYECIEDADCKKSERCNLILNSCELIPEPDMPASMDMGDAHDLAGVEDMNPSDLGPPDDLSALDMMSEERPDLSQSGDMTPPVQDLGDRIAPSLVAISPTEGASLTRESASWRVTFDEPLDPLSVSPFTVSLEDAEDEELAIEVTVNETGEEILVTLAEEEPFAPSALYTLSISEQVRDPSFNSLRRREEFLYYPELPADNANHELAMKWAPVVYQEIHDTSAGRWRHDVPSRIDFDQNFASRDNLSSLATMPEDGYRAAAYYHVAQTPSHHFITYIYYYPSRLIAENPGSQLVHAEHDFTGVLLVIERATSELLIAEGLRVEESTDLLIAFTNAERASEVNLPGEGRIKGTFSSAVVSGTDSTRYPLYVPSGRHEACYWPEPEVRPPYDVCVHPEGEFRTGKQGVLLEPAEVGMTWSEAIAPSDPMTAAHVASMTYELIPFDEIFWLKSSLVGSDLLFNRRRTYTPEGGRPGQRPDGSPILLPMSLPNDSSARSYGKSPYTWLTQPARSNRGQWLIDPAWTIVQRYNVPDMPAWSQSYCYNLTLGIDARQSVACQTSSPSP